MLREATAVPDYVERVSRSLVFSNSEVPEIERLDDTESTLGVWGSRMECWLNLPEADPRETSSEEVGLCFLGCLNVYHSVHSMLIMIVASTQTEQVRVSLAECCD